MSHPIAPGKVLVSFAPLGRGLSGGIFYALTTSHPVELIEPRGNAVAWINHVTMRAALQLSLLEIVAQPGYNDALTPST